MNARVGFEEAVLWKVLGLSFMAHVALLAAWPETRVSSVSPRPRAELAFIDVPPPRVEVESTPAPVQRSVTPRTRPGPGRADKRSAPAQAPVAPTSPPEVAVTTEPSALVLPVFTLPPQSTGPGRVGPPGGGSSTGPASTGSFGPGAGALGGDAEPRLDGEVRVPYPASAREQGVEGSVKLRVTVDAAGAVQQVVVLSGPGFGLDDAAREALMKFRFKPALRGGQPVGSTFLYTYTFELD